MDGGSVVNELGISDYYDNLGDRALSNITHLTRSGAILSKFDYAYSAPGRVSDWSDTSKVALMKSRNPSTAANRARVGPGRRSGSFTIRFTSR